MPAGWIALLLLSFPVLEAVSIFAMADAIGGWTLLWLIADVLVGVWLIRFERVVWGARLMMALRGGGNPLPALLASGRVLLAGGLLAFPGFVSDALALILLLLPGAFTRPRGATNQAGDGPGSVPSQPQPGDAPATLDGEFKRVTDDLPPRP